MITPLSWSVVELESIARVSYGKALSAGMRSEKGKIPVVGSSGVVGRHNQELVDGPCVVIGRKGAAGAVHLIGQSSWPIDTAYFIQPPTGVDLRYLYFFLGSQQLGQLDKSTAIPSLSRDDLYKVKVPVAPQSEQVRIVEKLEELLSDLDAGVAELRAAQRKLAQYRQSLLKAAVEGTLTADWRAARESVRPELVEGRASSAHASTSSARTDGGETGAALLQRILTERRTRWETRQLAKFAEQDKTPPKDWQAKYPEPFVPDTADLPELPDGWTWATIDQVAHVGTGVTPLRSKQRYFQDGTIPWVTSGALNDEVVCAATEYVTPLAMAECRLELYPVGSLLVAMYGEGKTRGKCSELALPATINQAIAALVFEGSANEVRSHVKTFLLDAYEAMRKQASGGVQPNLNLQIIKSLPFPLPPTIEQVEIQWRTDDQLMRHDELGVEISRGLKQSAAQRKNILKAAFAGQLVPQDPNDEPASVLLERVRAERATQSMPGKKRGRTTRTSA